MSRARLKVAALCGYAGFPTPGFGPPLCENREASVDGTIQNERPVGFIDLGHILLPVRGEFADWYSGLMTGTALLELATMLFDRRAQSVLAEILGCERAFITRYELPGTMAPAPLSIAILRVCCQIRIIDQLALLDPDRQRKEFVECKAALVRAFEDHVPIEDPADFEKYGIWGHRLTLKVIDHAQKQRYDFGPFEDLFGSLADRKSVV